MTSTTVHDASHQRNADSAGPAYEAMFHLARVDHLGVVSLSGRDAATFLHNQVSNDVETLAVHDTVLAAYCNPKGRVIAMLRVARTGEDSFLLVMPRELIDAVVKRLRMFVLRAKAELEPMEQAIVFALPNPSQAAQRFDELPAANRMSATDDGWLIHAGTSADRYTYITPAGSFPGGMTADAGDDAWLGLLAADAQPQVFASTSEAFLPQALNMDRIGALNFRKGCYPGQEIVARLRYLGKLKQRMVRISFTGTAPPPGTDVLAGGSKIGQLVLAGPVAGEHLGLASIHFAKLKGTTLNFQDGTELAVSMPHYDVPELQQAQAEESQGG